MDESMINFIKRGKLYDEGGSGNRWRNMVCILLFTLVQYLKLRIIPTIIIVSTPLFFLCCHKNLQNLLEMYFLALSRELHCF